MKKLTTILALAAVAIVLTLGAGCGAKVLNEETVPLINPKTGKLLKDKNGNPMLGTHKYSDEAAFTRGQVALAQARKPVAQLKAPNNAPLVLPAGAEFTVWGRNGAEVEIKQYVSELVQVMKEIRGMVREAGLPTVATVAVVKSADARGNTTTYKDSANNNQGVLGTGSGNVQGGVSSVAVSGEGNSGSGTASPTRSETNSKDGDTSFGLF
jgi:hypothetical protein